MDLRETYEKQIKMLEKLQEKAMEYNDFEKVEELAISIISISNTINSMK